MNNETAINEWLRFAKREQGRTPSTLYSYTQEVRRLATYLGRRSVLAVTSDTLRAFVHEPLTRGTKAGQVPSDATIKRRVATLRSLYKFLHAEGLTDRDPSARLVAPTVRNENPKPVEHDAWVQVWRSDMEPTCRLMLIEGFMLGQRRAEIVRSTPAHFTTQDGWKAGYVRKGQKLGNTPWQSIVGLFDRELPHLIGSATLVADTVATVLADRESCGLLYPWAGRTSFTENQGTIDPSVVNRRLRRLCANAGVPVFTPHQMRHSFCTNLLGMGVPLLDVSKLAGHSNVVVTQRYLATSDDPIAGMLNSHDQGGIRVAARW